MTQANAIIELQELNHADRDASVKLVSIDGQKYVLKTDSLREVAAQAYFYRQLQQHGIPSLETHTHVRLQPNQLLLEYVEDSKTLGHHLNVERCRAWGELVAQVHAIKMPDFLTLNSAGQQVGTDWREYLQSYITSAVKRHRTLPYTLDDELISHIEQILSRLLDCPLSDFSLIHGDLHVHNVLLKGETLILFDKFADFLMAPAAFDLGVVYAEVFGGAAYPELGFTTDQQQDYFTAFLDGYGGLPSDQLEWLEYFVLLRAFYRWPNRFAPHSGEVMRLLAKRLA